MKPPEIQVHDHARNLERKLANLEASALSEGTKNSIRGFIDKCAADGLSLARRSFYATYLKGLAEILGSAFRRPKRADIERALTEIEARNYEAWTKIGYRVTIKKFYRWALGRDEELPPCVKWIKVKKDGIRNRLPRAEDLLTDEEVSGLIRMCLNERDRALVSLLDDSGVRIGELLTLRVGDVAFDAYGLVIHVEGKTGRRRVRVVGNSIAHVAAWLEVHPAREDRVAPLFTGLDERTHGRAMNYAQGAKVFRSAARRAKITKPVNPHSFRHRRATILAKRVPEAPLEAQMGWVPGSQMAKVYVHLSGRDVDEAILRAHGIKTVEEKPEATAKACGRCGTLNTADANSCRKCGLPLDEKTALEVQEKVQVLDDFDHALTQDPVSALAAFLECMNVDAQTLAATLRRLKEASA